MCPCALAMEHSCIKTLPQDQDRSSHSISILEALKAPRTSELTRKHKVHCNPPPKELAEKAPVNRKRFVLVSSFQGSKTLFTFQVESKCGCYRFPCVISILLISKCIWPESRVSSLCCSSWRHWPIIWSTSFWKRHEVTYQIGVGLLDRCFLYSRLQQPPSMYSLYLRTPSETDRMQHFKTI